MIVGCGLLSCALGVVGYGVNPLAALGLTDPVDDEALTSPLVRPAAAVPARTSSPDKHASGFATGNPLWGVPLDSLSATRERPLFSPSRRPPHVTAAAPPPQAPPPPPPPAPAQPSLTLVGTVIGEGQRIGIFVDQTTNAVVRLRTGEGDGGWTVHSVGDREAVLEQDHRDVTLSLPTNNGTNQMTASVPPPATPAGIAAPAPTPVAVAAPAVAPQPAAAVPSPAAMSLPAPQPKAAQQRGAEQQRTVAPPGMWLDGDGHIIKAPPRPTYADGKPPAATWADGDGRLIAAPPATLVGQH